MRLTSSSTCSLLCEIPTCAMAFEKNTVNATWEKALRFHIAAVVTVG
jgi:hypothetical protein